MYQMCKEQGEKEFAKVVIQVMQKMNSNEVESAAVVAKKD